MHDPTPAQGKFRRMHPQFLADHVLQVQNQARPSQLSIASSLSTASSVNIRLYLTRRFHARPAMAPEKSKAPPNIEETRVPPEPPTETRVASHSRAVPASSILTGV